MNSTLGSYLKLSALRLLAVARSGVPMYMYSAVELDVRSPKYLVERIDVISATGNGPVAICAFAVPKIVVAASSAYVMHFRVNLFMGVELNVTGSSTGRGS